MVLRLKFLGFQGSEGGGNEFVSYYDPPLA